MLSQALKPIPLMARRIAVFSALALMGLTGCNPERMNEPGVLSAQNDSIPAPNLKLSALPEDGLREDDRQAIAVAVGSVNLNGPVNSTVAQNPANGLSAALSNIELNQERGLGCRTFKATISDRTGVRDQSGVVCPMSDGWRLLKEGERGRPIPTGDILPGVLAPGSTTQQVFVETPQTDGSGPVFDPTNVPIIQSDVLDSDLFGSGPALPDDPSVEPNADPGEIEQEETAAGADE